MEVSANGSFPTVCNQIHLHKAYVFLIPRGKDTHLDLAFEQAARLGGGKTMLFRAVTTFFQATIHGCRAHPQ
jgi:hypothetical protein